MDDVEKRGRRGMAVRTWGGRLIHSEPAKMVKGRYMEFSYKLTNYLIQGSAADQTKQAVVDAGYQTRHRRFLATVHDENVFSIDPDHLREEVQEVRASMEHQEGWDVPFKTKVKIGPNWHNLEVYNDGMDATIQRAAGAAEAQTLQA